MSTFNGIVKEFPAIRIDQFRTSPDPASTPPLAFFLSHVHSDHLAGLESCKSPFIYCSPGTKEILLRLEKYPHRMNFAKGVLETRKQTYKHLRKLLKAIPLDTPTQIDLTPDRSLRVTLLDANHCVGAVMFLIEGDGKAILYTGDIRSEAWWVNAMTRHPMLLPYCYSNGKRPIKQLDCVYLDTTFANKSDRYKHFQPKQEGVAELLQKVAKYPQDTIFYFDSWTFGYEDVWIALSSFLGCHVHVDNYRYKLYSALVTGAEPKALEGPGLIGFTLGNHVHRGCLTEDATARLHSCEQGTGCDIFKRDFVRITPIIARHNGRDMAELGAGGGQGDLDQQHELEVFDIPQLSALMKLCSDELHEQPQALTSVMTLLASLVKDPVQTIALDFVDILAAHADATANGAVDAGDPSLSSLVPALVRLASKREVAQTEKAAPFTPDGSKRRADGLPTRITFPYSRHSSYTELCHLLEAFKPTDVHPCTAESTHWGREQSMAFLFGHLYDSVCNFTHDRMMVKRQRHRKPGRQKLATLHQDSEDEEVSEDDRHELVGPDLEDAGFDAGQRTTPVLASTHSEAAAILSSPTPSLPQALHRSFGDQTTSAKSSRLTVGPATQLQTEMNKSMAAAISNDTPPVKRRRLQDFTLPNHDPPAAVSELTSDPASSGTVIEGDRPECYSVDPDSVSMARGSLSPTAIAFARKTKAHDAALDGDWEDITLVSVSGYHQDIEVEL